MLSAQPEAARVRVRRRRATPKQIFTCDVIIIDNEGSRLYGRRTKGLGWVLKLLESIGFEVDDVAQLHLYGRHAHVSVMSQFV